MFNANKITLYLNTIFSDRTFLPDLTKSRCSLLDVSLGSITGWKQAYEFQGIDGLGLNHKGRKSYLSSEQKEEVLSWLQTKNCWELGELEYKLAFEYDVVYESKQSYYRNPI